MAIEVRTSRTATDAHPTATDFDVSMAPEGTLHLYDGPRLHDSTTCLAVYAAGSWSSVKIVK
jgi:hypothetical protein